MKAIVMTFLFVVFLRIITNISDAESALMFVTVLTCTYVLDILRILKKERLSDDDTLRAIYERDRLLAALKAMQEANPGLIQFTPKTGEQIKKARAAWVSASAIISEVESSNVK